MEKENNLIPEQKTKENEIVELKDEDMSTISAGASHKNEDLSTISGDSENQNPLKFIGGHLE